MPQKIVNDPAVSETRSDGEILGPETVKKHGKVNTVGSDGKTALEKVGTASVYLAIVIFIFNMTGAWYMVVRSGGVVGRALIDPTRPTASSLALEKMSGADGNGHVFLNHLLTAELQLRTVQNQQTLSVVVMSAAFALLAIGFALFVMGAEGAFKITGKISDGQNLVLKSTAPGLLCFILSALFIYATISRGQIQVIDASREVSSQPSSAGVRPSEPGATGIVKSGRVDLGPAGPPRSLGKPADLGIEHDIADSGTKR